LHLIEVLCFLQEQSPILGSAPPPSAPNCLVSHLTFIEFKGFRGFPEEVSFVEYVLQNGLVLETMIIDVTTMDRDKKCSILFVLALHQIKDNSHFNYTVVELHNITPSNFVNFL